jgi:hypothetical protein
MAIFPIPDANSDLITPVALMRNPGATRRFNNQCEKNEINVPMAIAGA